MIKLNTSLHAALSRRLVQRLDQLVLLNASGTPLVVFKPLQWDLRSPGVIFLKNTPVQAIAQATGVVTSARLESSNYAEAIVEIRPEDISGIATTVTAGQILQIDGIEIYFGDEFVVQTDFFIYSERRYSTLVTPDIIYSNPRGVFVVPLEIVFATRP